MEKLIRLPFVKKLEQELANQDPLIQVIIGPRQVGKTTGIELLIEGLDASCYAYHSADGIISYPASWIYERWTMVKNDPAKEILVIDEIQKIEDWSECIKKLWDQEHFQKNTTKKIKLVLLGSSSLAIQKGLSESLAGRFQLHKVFHWNYAESNEAYNLSFDDYLIYGGYPGSYRFINNQNDWLSYIKESIIESVIGKDILLINKVKSPALFRQCFDLVCSYPAQEISYTKLLGQLQDKGNTDLIKYYLELFEGAFLIKQLFKFSTKKISVKSSSPKILPLCPALYSITLDGALSQDELGRAFELVVGASLTRLPGKLFYWREKNFEVDYVYQFGKKIWAIEVKSGIKKNSKGLLKFKEKYPNSEALIITPQNFTQILTNLT